MTGTLRCDNIDGALSEAPNAPASDALPIFASVLQTKTSGDEPFPLAKLKAESLGITVVFF